MCPIGRRELGRRQRNARDWIGRQLQELRTDAGISQSALAAAAGVDQGHLSRIERGLIQPGFDLLIALGACLGADLGVRLFPTAGPRLHDRFQAPMLEALLRMRHPSWAANPEVPVPAARGVIDLVLTRGTDRSTIACECHSELRRLELALRRGAEKADALGPRFEDGPPPSRLLLLRSTDSTRAVARTFEATLLAAFPGRAADALAALRAAEAPWPGATLLWATVSAGRAELLDRPPRGVRVGR
jgi:transcriptional regulator with XRE-family HTH domain